MPTGTRPGLQQNPSSVTFICLIKSQLKVIRHAFNLADIRKQSRNSYSKEGGLSRDNRQRQRQNPKLSYDVSGTHKEVAMIVGSAPDTGRA